MPLLNTIDEIYKLKNKIDELGKLPYEILKKINYKFRLEWNYTSNSIEGNSLTKQETRSVMVGNVTVDGKPFKDVAEIRGHDEVVKEIMRIGKGELNIAENRIKQIHKTIIYEEDESKQPSIGKWKQSNNHVINYKGEKFEFVSFTEVPEKIHELINWLQSQKEKIQANSKDALHPFIVAFQFHLDFVSIHPFYDGNGRMARILTNLILISYGYPPIYVLQNEKDSYNKYLADIQAYGGSPDLFYQFMCGLLKRSMQIILDAAAGKEIEEEDDVLKEISLWKNSINAHNAKEVIAKSNEIIAQLYKENLSRFLNKFSEKMHKAFYDLFASWEELGWVNNNNSNRKNKLYIDERVERLKATFSEDVDSVGDGFDNEINSFSLRIDMNGFKKDGINTFFENASIEVVFTSFKYIIKTNTGIEIEKLYNEYVTEDEQNQIINNVVKAIFENIKRQMKNLPLKDL